MRTSSRPARAALVAALLAAAALPSAPLAAQPAPLRGLGDYIERSMDAWDVPGLGIAVVKDGEVVLAEGYGVRSVDTGEPADANTIFAIGSASKAFTTAALAMLIDEGKLSWDDRVVDVLPGFELSDPWVTREMRVRDLVAHRVATERLDRLWYGTPYDREEVVRRTRGLPFIEQFRVDYGYNNLMFIVAGEVVEEVSGMSWDRFVDERIFSPLGMDRSVTSVDPLPRMEDVATPHERTDDAVRTVPWRDLDNAGPAGSINSSAADMAHWALLQLGHGEVDGRRLISEEQVEEMHAPQTIIPLEEWVSSLSPVNHQMVPGTNFFAYGLGWFLQDYRGRKLVHHGGAIDGMRALVMLVPGEDLGVVVLTNRGGANSLMTGVALNVVDRYLGEPVRDWAGDILAKVEPLEARAATAAARMKESRVTGTSHSLPLDAYTGSYTQPAQGDARITRSGGGLRLELPGHGATLEHWHHDTFLVDWDALSYGEGFATFRLDARGEVAELEVTGFGEYERVREGAARN